MERSTTTVLLVDDNSLLRKALKGHLEARGYRVVDFASGDEAVDYAAHAEEPIAYAFIDHVLDPFASRFGQKPCLNGIGTTQQLMKIDPTMCIVVFSGQLDISDDERQEALQAGARRYVYKGGAAIGEIIDGLMHELDELRELRTKMYDIRQQRGRMAMTMRESPLGTLLLDREYRPWGVTYDWRRIEGQIDPIEHPLHCLADFLATDTFRRELVDAALHGEERDGPALCKMHSGQLKYLHILARPLRNTQGTVIGCLLAMLDQTALDVVRQTPLPERLRVIAQSIQRAGYDRVRLYRISPNQDRMLGVVEVGGGLYVENFSHLEIPLNSANFLRQAWEEKQPCFWRIDKVDPVFRAELGKTSDFIIVPIFDGKQLLSVMAVDREKSWRQNPLNPTNIAPLLPYAEEVKKAFRDAPLEEEPGDPPGGNLAALWANIEKSQDVHEAMEVILSAVHTLTGCAEAHIRVREREMAVMVGSIGEFAKYRDRELPWDGAYWDIRAMQIACPLIVQDTNTLPPSLFTERESWSQEAKEAFSTYARAMAFFPLLFGTDVLGVLTVLAPTRSHFTSQRRRLLMELVRIAAMAWVDHSRAQDRRAIAQENIAFATIHNLRQPLTALRGTLDLLLTRHVEGTLTMNAVVEDLRDARKYLKRSEDIIGDVLRFLKPLDLRVTPIVLRELIESARDSVPQEQGHVTIEIDVPPTITMEVDRESLRQVFEELFHNASHALASHGTIRTSASTAAYRNQHGEPVPAIRIVVEDNGPGIPSDLAQKLFIPFAMPSATGTSLGLAFIKRVIDEHHGHIWYEPVNPHGARFVFVLPAMVQRKGV